MSRTYEPWRWTCPNGHTSWVATTDGYQCDSCGMEFGELRDMKNGEASRPENRGGNPIGGQA